MMDLCHLKNSELEPQFQNLQRQSRTWRWHCKRWFWFVCSVHWTRIISISNNSRKSHGHYIKASRMFRTSRCSIRWNSGQNGRRINVVENSKVRMSRYLDTSTKTKMAKIMVQYGKPSRPFRKESVRSPFGRTHGKGNLRKFYQNTVGKSLKLGMFICQPSKRTILIRVCGRYQTGRQDRKHRTDLEIFHGRRWPGRTNILTMKILGCTQRECKISNENCGKLQRYVRWSQGKTTYQSFRETWSRNNTFLVVWHGRSRKEMCGKMLRTAE